MHGPSAGVWVLVLTAAALPGAAQDIRVSVPIEYSSGVAVTAPSPKPFAAGVRTAFLARLGSEGTVLVGPAGGWLDDGDGVWAGGARAGLRLPALGVRDAGVFLTVEALRGRGRTPVTAALFVDLAVKPALFARFGATVTRDFDRRDDEVALMIGVDVARWAVEVFGSAGPHRVRR
jgi:hypothetical protein